MSVLVSNTEFPQEKEYTATELQVGVLYKISTGRHYSTVYTKTLQGDIIWFENEGSTDANRIGSSSKAANCTYKFVEAPKGTQVLIRNN